MFEIIAKTWLGLNLYLQGLGVRLKDGDVLWCADYQRLDPKSMFNFKMSEKVCQYFWSVL